VCVDVVAGNIRQPLPVLARHEGGEAEADAAAADEEPARGGHVGHAEAERRGQQ